MNDITPLNVYLSEEYPSFIFKNAQDVFNFAQDERQFWEKILTVDQGKLSSQPGADYLLGRLRSTILNKISNIEQQARSLINVELNEQQNNNILGALSPYRSKQISQDYVGKGLGVDIFDNLLKWLGTNRPLATVSEEKMPAFERLFDHYGFVLTNIENGLYRSGKLEYVFNHPSSPLLRSGI